MFRTYKYRIRPTPSQEATLVSWLGLTRELYNAALQERNEAWRKQRKSIGKYDQYRQLASIREIRPDINVPIAALRGILGRAENAYADFFRRCKAGKKAGFPRFKSEKRWNSIEFASKPANTHNGTPCTITRLNGECIASPEGEIKSERWYAEMRGNRRAGRQGHRHAARRHGAALREDAQRRAG